MEFVHYDLNHLSGGEAVEVTLDKAANVSLVDSANFDRYRTGRQFTYYGGYTTSSPYVVRVPYGGHWHVVIDLGGYGGQIRTAVRVLRDA